MKETSPNNSWVVEHFGKQIYLLLSLVILLVFLPLFTATASQFWLICVLMLIMLTGPLSLAARQLDLYLTVTIGLIMVTTSWIGEYTDSAVLIAIDGATTVIFFAILAALLFRKLYTSRDRIETETLLTAINAYLSIGIMYAFAYWYMMRFDPNALSGTFMSDPQFQSFVYLSFVTMTTLGYGDITPQSELAAILTYSQALIGQLFIAITIASIVGRMAASD